MMKKMSPFILFLCFNAYCMDPDTAWKIQSSALAKNISITAACIKLEKIHDKRIMNEIYAQYCENLANCFNDNFKNIAYNARRGKTKNWDTNPNQILEDSKYDAFRKPISLPYNDFANFVIVAANRKRLGKMSIAEVFLAHMIRSQQKEGYFIKLINAFYNTDEQEKKIYADWEFIKKFEKID